jgi:hypothetical protein
MLTRKTVRFPVEQINFEAMFGGSNKLTIKTWEERWIANVKYNRDLVDKGMQYKTALDLLALPRHHIAIVCGAGPSLKRQARYLRNVPKEWAILCADHALLPVLEEGIEPSFVVSMDGDQTPDIYIQEGIKRLRYGYPAVPVLLDVVACPTITNQVKNAYWFKSASDPETKIMRYVQELFPDITKLGHGGNVGSAVAIVATYFMFARHIILVGLDSSLAPGRERVIYYHGQIASDEHKYIDVHDIYGRNIQTVGNLHNYKIWLDHFTYSNSHVEWINANDGGYLGVNSMYDNFEHYQYMPLKDAIEYLKKHGDDD